MISLVMKHLAFTGLRLTSREIKRAERRAKIAVEIILNAPMELMTDKEKALAVLTATRVQPILANLISERTTLRHLEKNYKLPLMPRE